MNKKDDRPLPEKVREWLAEQGYPLELRVGRIFRATGWDVEFARLYKDLETQKIRDIDVVATMHRSRPPTGSIHFHWAIECKSSVGKPWVVLTTERQIESIGPTAVDFAPGLVGTGVLLDAIDLGDRMPTFEVPARIGHGVVRAFSDGKSGDPTGAYSALLSATSASASLTKASAEFWLRHGSQSVAVINAFIPAVVIEGPLFEMTLNSEGAETLSEIERAVAWVRTPGAETSSSLVNIINVAALERFAKQAASDVDVLLDIALPRTAEIWQAMQSKAEERAF